MINNVNVSLHSKLYVTQPGEVAFNTSVCNYDCKVGDVQANTLYGPIINQIKNEIAHEIKVQQVQHKYKLEYNRLRQNFD